MGTTKESWMKAHLALPDNDEIVSAFQRVGTLSLTPGDFKDEDALPSIIAPLESFLCSVYAPLHDSINT